MQLDVGQRFDRYQVIRPLGNGISGESYEALDTLLQRTVTLKLIHPWTTLSDAIRRQFFRELQNMSLLNHSTLASILDYGDVDGQLYMARKYTSFGSLLSTQGRSWFSPPLPLEQAIRYTIQLAQALQYLHANRFLHGALTFSNLLVQSNPLEQNSSTAMPLLLADAGTAHFVRRYGHPFITLLPITAAPEQFSKRTVPASDQYALAIILYYWLAGRPPFLGTPDEIEQQKRSGSTLPLSNLNPHVTPTIVYVIQRALRASIEERYPSLQAFAEALHNAYQPLLYGETNPSIPTPTTKQETFKGPHTPIPAILENQSSHAINQQEASLIEAFSTLTAFIEPPVQPIKQTSTEPTSPSILAAMLSSLLPPTDTQEVPTAPTTPETPTIPVQPEQAPLPEPNPDPIKPEPTPIPEPTPTPAQPEPLPTPQPEPEPLPTPEPLPQPVPDVPQPLPEPTPAPNPLPEIIPETTPETPSTPAPELPLPPAPDIAQPLPDPNMEPELSTREHLSTDLAVDIGQVLPQDEAPSNPSSEAFAPIESAEQTPVRFPLLIITSPYVENPHEVIVDRDEMTIGRAGSSDILLDYDPFTSRHHALLQRQDEGYCLSDRRSAYGTLINGQKLTSEQKHLLQDGDQIVIGQYKIIFYASPTSEQNQALASQNVEA
jgi:serine/threonine protein kinase